MIVPDLGTTVCYQWHFGGILFTNLSHTCTFTQITQSVALLDWQTSVLGDICDFSACSTLYIYFFCSLTPSMWLLVFDTALLLKGTVDGILEVYNFSVISLKNCFHEY